MPEESTQALCKYDTPQLKVIQKTVFPEGTPDEVRLFGIVCTRTGLDPFTKQIYAVKNRGQVQIMTGIDGFRSVASRSPRYLGQDGPYWCGEDGQWKDVWLEGKPPSAAKVIVRTLSPSGQVMETPAVAHWHEYGSNRNVWAKMPSLMLAKCAESLALRKAFPNDMSGLYTHEEMSQAQPEEPPKPQATLDQSLSIVNEVIEEASDDPIIDVEPEPEAEEPDPLTTSIPTKVDFLALLKQKGIDNPGIAMSVIKSIATSLFQTDDMRKVSDEQKQELYVNIESKTPQDLIPE